ncbi:MAG: GntR family transcriptional regulator [Actinobacteria bacterium]|nr:GntR family transcriptional regulator [Actinomycetota bacterium]
MSEEIPLSRDGRATELAHRRMRSAILQGNLAPGQLLSQVDLARHLDVSRTPLRDAVRTLQEEGLVQARGRRLQVAGFSIADLEDLYSLRLLVETVAVGVTVPQLRPEELAELRGLLAQMNHHGDRRDFDRTEIPHRRFHGLLVAGAGARTTKLVQRLFDHAERYRRAYSTLDESVFTISADDHRQLFEAASAGDAARAARISTGHSFRTAERLIAELDPSHRPGHLKLAREMALAQAEELPRF